MRSFVTGGSGFVGRELIRALVERGHAVRALARSERSAQTVRDAGAEPVLGDLDAVDAMAAGMADCGWVFHCAAHTEEWDTDEAFHRVNVVGTDHVLAAARAAGARRFILISSESVLADGSPLVDVDEKRPIPPRPLPGYPASKALAEQHVRAANGEGGLDTLVVRPRLIWGRGDTSNLVKFIDAAESGRLAWIDGGHYTTSTCHIANVCEGTILAAEKGAPGEVYFLSDGAPVEFRWYLSRVLESQGRTPPTRSVPRWIAATAAAIVEPLWRATRASRPPPATRVAVALMGQQVTVSDEKARRELGYRPRITVEEGLAELSRLPPVKPLPAKG